MDQVRLICQGLTLFVNRCFRRESSKFWRPTYTITHKKDASCLPVADFFLKLLPPSLLVVFFVRDKHSDPRNTVDKSWQWLLTQALLDICTWAEGTRPRETRIQQVSVASSAGAVNPDASDILGWEFMSNLWELVWNGETWEALWSFVVGQVSSELTIAENCHIDASQATVVCLGRSWRVRMAISSAFQEHCEAEGEPGSQQIHH